MPTPDGRRLARIAFPLVAGTLYAVAATAPAEPATRSPTSGGGAATVGVPSSPSASPRTLWRRIFTCVSADVVEFSDRPCGPRATEREVRLLNPGVGQTGGTSNVAPTRASAAPREAGPVRSRESRGDDAAGAAKVQAETCERLVAAVDTLDDRMRAGYSAREAARLWARWREAKARLHEADC